MLSEQEKEGCKNILNKLPRQDLINLTDTVTNRVVSPENASGKVFLYKLVLFCTVCTNSSYNLLYVLVSMYNGVTFCLGTLSNRFFFLELVDSDRYLF